MEGTLQHAKTAFRLRLRTNIQRGVTLTFHLVQNIGQVSSIPDSAKWRAEIFAAIEAADNFLFVISPDSVKSWMCGQEVSHADANNKRLITVLYHSVDTK